MPGRPLVSCEEKRDPSIWLTFTQIVNIALLLPFVRS
jgi:hypothetical protein